ncbi:alpha-L-arabinofuranosidase A [Sphaerosporella brunnea]|uniref:non-reducing end alpha-L-arabinofuranosidase n=1 Tax=Sphaerosporella brunnea TaxID=1250544 RepID=A0A5J5EJI9_9PEZI|nr:alpha-L-arabinofuranosidase A [Sphaerosporella brunnea]
MVPLVALGVLLFSCTTTAQNTTGLTLEISVASGTRNKTAPYLHGLFFEDINHSGDGGLYAELIRNRAFQGSDVTIGGSSNIKGSHIVASENPLVPWGPTLTGWRAIGSARLSLDVLNPLSTALPTVMRVDIPVDATGEVGILNEGWWGMDIQPQEYTASFYIKPAQAVYSKSLTHITTSLRSNATGEIWAAEEIRVDGPTLSTLEYTQFRSTLFPAKAAPDSDNTFAVTFNASEVAGNSFFVSLVSLFPPTYKDRPNGLRKDLAEVLAEIRPKFLRFPGGNNLEGLTIQTRWQWKKNIGPLTERPGRPGDWSYYNTDGLGYLEFLEWCEDMEIEPLLSVYAGYSLDITNISPANTVPQESMQPYITEALEQLEYAMGSTETKWGALRASHGHPSPFQIRFVEIGNEDFFSSSYYWRFPLFYSALKAVYPNVTFIATQATESSPSGINTAIPAGNMWDMHHYETPQFFKDNFNYFDNWQNASGYGDGVQIFVGEYSVLSRDRPGGVDWSNGVGRFAYPTMVAAIGEAIYGLAMERNPHVVQLSSYAPLLQNFNAYQWTPNFIAFTADTKDTVRSTSYYWQKMFSWYKGTETLPVRNSEGGFDPVWWHAAIDAEETGTLAAGRVYVKLINADTTPHAITLNLDVKVSTVNGTILTNEDEYAFNYRNNATAISPKTFTLDESVIGNGGKQVTYELPGLAIVVLELK